jgi:ABC-type nitrate/sulfonate/bicarbonate transport system substrate-binding protein
VKRIAYIFSIFIVLYFVSLSYAREIRVLTPPDPNSIPLMVLEEKTDAFLPKDTTLKIVVAPAGDVSAMKAIMAQKKADIGLFNFLAGGKFYSQGIKNIRLAGVHVWGGIAILSKRSIKAGDWKALNGKTAIAVPAVKTPPYVFAMMAAKKNGADPKSLKVVGMGPAIAMNKMRMKAGSPDFVMVPEPLLSIMLHKQEKENWEQKYHLFADTARAVSPSGVPLGAFWIIDGENAPAYDEIIYGFEKAIDFVNDPANSKEVAEITSRGFKTHFNMVVPPSAFEQMVNRGNLKLKFRESSQITEVLKVYWRQKKTALDDQIFYERKTYRIAQNSPFLSQMMPRAVGAIQMHGADLGLSQKSVEVAMKVAKVIVPKVAIQSREIGKIEEKIFNLTLSEAPKAEIEKILETLSQKKLELSRVQTDCVKMVFEGLTKEDSEKIKAFFRKNKNLMLNKYGFMF